MATLFHNCSLLIGFVPLEALEGLSTQRVATAEIESRVRGGPALYISKLMMTYAAFTRYFTRPIKLLYFRELLQYYQGIFAYLRITYHTFGANEGWDTLKKKATIALPRHNGENPKNSFSPFILVLIVMFHSVSLGKLSLSQDLHWIILYYEIIINTFFLTWHCNQANRSAKWELVHVIKCIWVASVGCLKACCWFISTLVF